MWLFLLKFGYFCLKFNYYWLKFGHFCFKFDFLLKWKLTHFGLEFDYFCLKYASICSISSQKVEIIHRVGAVIFGLFCDPFGLPGFLVMTSIGSSLNNAARFFTLLMSFMDTCFISMLSLKSNLNRTFKSTDETSGMITVLTLHSGLFCLFPRSAWVFSSNLPKILNNNSNYL